MKLLLICKTEWRNGLKRNIAIIIPPKETRCTCESFHLSQVQIDWEICWTYIVVFIFTQAYYFIYIRVLHKIYLIYLYKKFVQTYYIIDTFQISKNLSSRILYI